MWMVGNKQTSCFPLPPWSAMGGAVGVATDPSPFLHLPVWEVDQPRTTRHRGKGWSIVVKLALGGPGG